MIRLYLGCKNGHRKGYVNCDISKDISPDKIFNLEKKVPFEDNFNSGNYSHEVESKENMIEISKVKLNFGIGKSSKLNCIFNPLINLNHTFCCRFFTWTLSAPEIYFELKILK